MDMRKILALVTLTASFAFALGYNCIPNIGITSITDQIRGIFGG
jgi:hypothetical protein